MITVLRRTPGGRAEYTQRVDEKRCTSSISRWRLNGFTARRFTATALSTDKLNSINAPTLSTLQRTQLLYTISLFCDFSLFLLHLNFT